MNYVCMGGAGLVHEYQGPDSIKLLKELKETTLQRRRDAFVAINLADKWNAMPRGTRNKIE